MITTTIYVSSDVMAWLINLQKGNITVNQNDRNAIKKVSLRKTRKDPIEIQIPIEAISQYFPHDNYATIALYRVNATKK